MTETIEKKKLYVHIPTKIVRNDDIYLSNDEFAMYARLCFLYFLNYKEKEMEFDHKKLMTFLHISDTRTFKKRLNSLYELGLIENKIEKLPTKGTMFITFNDKVGEDGHFTKMSSEVFSYYKNEQIDEYALRQIFYYKSHINVNDRERNRKYCFVGYETLVERLKISKSKVEDANKQLKKTKLIRVEKHKLAHNTTYNENDELIFERYNNHYYVKESLH